MSDINFSKLTWENLPARTTALSATNLNRIESGIADSVNGVNSNSHSIAELQTRISQMSGGVPPTASSTSGMNPEVSPIYVNTTDGNWYYYDGSAWQIGGVYGGAVTSTTFDKHGVPADDFAVGQALADKADADEIGDLSQLTTTAKDNLVSAINEANDAVTGINGRLDQLKEPVVITHSETVEKGFHVLTFDEPILEGTEVTVIGTAATASNSFTAIFRDSNGNSQSLGTLGISTKKLTGVLEFDAVDFRSYVNGTEWGFTITYGEGVVAEVEDVREGVNGVVYGSAGEAVRTQVKNTEDVVNIVGQKTLSLLDIDPSATAENWTLIANGLCESNSNGRMRKYSVTPGQLLFMSISKDTYGVYQFQNNASVPASGINNYLVGHPVTEAIDGFVVVPDGATYLIVSQLKANITNAIKLADSGSATDIISLNKGIRSLMIQAARPKNLSYNAYLNEPKPLMLLHFSDIHGDSTELARMVEFADSNSDMINDTICTGDVLATRWSSDFNYWSAVPGAEKILLAVGNHDVLTDTSGWDWSQRASQADQYTRFFAPFIGGWECSYESGKTYYYKDYDNSKIRLIVLNCMLTGSDDTAQLTWLGTVLSGAKAKDYSVVVANHYMIATPTKIPCNFSTIDKGVGTDVLPTAYLLAIQNYIDDGGKFICHIAGHTHWDVVVRSQDYPRQICIVVDALSRAQGNNYSDTQRTNGDKSQDLANVVAFDTSSGVVKVMRVGADVDHYLRQKHCLTIDYATGNIVAES